MSNTGSRTTSKGAAGGTRRLRRALAAGGIAAALVTSAPGTAVAGSGAHLYSPHASPQGRSYARIAGDFAQWAFSIPAPTSPVIHLHSPHGCEVHGPFVYTGSVGTDGTCPVPRGKAVVISFAGYECSTAEGNGTRFRALRRCARRNFAKTFKPTSYRFRMTLDGNHVPRPRRWTYTSANRVITLPTKNIWHAPPGPTRSSSRGMIYVLRPLSPGTHVLRVHAHDRTMGKLTFVYRFRSVSAGR